MNTTTITGPGIDEQTPETHRTEPAQGSRVFEIRSKHGYASNDNRNAIDDWKSSRTPPTGH